MENLNQVFFYTLENAIKSYRKMAQRNMMQQGFDLTIDQWLVLKAIIDNPDGTQQEIAEMAFKDFASATRIIELLVKKEYLTRAMHPDDRRRFALTPTSKALQNLEAMRPITESNRRKALEGISAEQVAQMQHDLSCIIKNCKS